MADLKKVRLQVINTETGEVLEEVDVKTSTQAVLNADGSTLKSLLDEMATNISNISNSNSTTIADVSLANGTGVLTFTKLDGTTFTIDTALEKVVANFKLSDDKQSLILVLDDGTELSVPMTSFIDVYTGTTGEKIQISIDANNKISGTIVGNSIIYDDLSLALQTLINAGKMTDEERAKLASLENYTHPITAGNKHIPSGGSSGQYLVNSADGAAVWKSIDTSLSSTSANVVQNKAVATAISNKAKIGTTYATATECNIFLKVDA